MRRLFASCRTSSASGPIAPPALRSARPGRGGGVANYQWRSSGGQHRSGTVTGMARSFAPRQPVGPDLDCILDLEELRRAQSPKAVAAPQLAVNVAYTVGPCRVKLRARTTSAEGGGEPAGTSAARCFASRRSQFAASVPKRAADFNPTTTKFFHTPLCSCPLPVRSAGPAGAQGLHATPWRISRQPGQASQPSVCRSSRASAAARRRAWMTGKASARPAQYAAGLVRSADCSPRPPRQAGRVARSRACRASGSAAPPRQRHRAKGVVRTGGST